MNVKEEVKQKLEQAIRDKKTSKVRGILDNNLLWFASDKELLIECYEIASQYSFIFDEHDNKDLDKNKTNWNEEYFHDVLGDSLSNYSQERYKFLIDLTYYLSTKKDTTKKTGNALDANKNQMPKSKPKVNSKTVEKSSNLNWLMLLGGIGIVIMIVLVIKKIMG